MKLRRIKPWYNEPIQRRSHGYNERHPRPVLVRYMVNNRDTDNETSLWWTMPVDPSAPRFIEVLLLATVCVIVRHQRTTVARSPRQLHYWHFHNIQIFTKSPFSQLLAFFTAFYLTSCQRDCLGMTYVLFQFYLAIVSLRVYIRLIK